VSAIAPRKRSYGESSVTQDFVQRSAIPSIEPIFSIELARNSIKTRDL